MSGTAWQSAGVAHHFLDERRAAVPYGADALRLLLQLVAHFRPRPERVLDLGCGDGIVARTVLEVYPDATALLLDHSEPMLARAREAMAPFAGRCEIRRADLAESIAEHAPPGSVDLVVSGYAIHHLPHARKRALYGEIYQALTPGGFFVNLEHVSSPTPEVEALFDALYIEHIAVRTGKPQAQVAAEYHGRPDKADNILESVETQVGWLRELGFQHADCYFKWLELVVFGGTKMISIGQ